MKYSRYNIFSKIKDSGNYFILNLLTGNADVLGAVEAEKIRFIIDNGIIPDNPFSSELISKGYLSEEDEEKKSYRIKYLDFLDARNNDEVQLFYVANYSCNFACTYCYQDQYVNTDIDRGTEVIDSFFNYIQKEFAGKRKYLTIFGGEPLLNSTAQKSIIEYLLNKSSEINLEVSVVTNGYNLAEYANIFKNRSIREIQVTLDGTQDIHDKRRFLKNGKGTFTAITEGIDACLRYKIPINLRMVIDRENIGNLPDLATVAINKGWTASRYFKTQIGRNYELHHCQSSPDLLFSRISLFEEIFELTKQYPHILDFYKPAYSVAKFLSENGTLPDPLFDACPACKTEWAFDYTGNIYSCTATVGKSDESLGTFYPEIILNREKVREWESRDVISIPECRNCSLQLACGGGCGSVAANRNGKIHSVDCRPVKELLELGFSQYFEKEEPDKHLIINTLEYQNK